MYPVSNAFHTAVKNDAEQKALLIFHDGVFTNSDINVTNGLELHDYFNTQTDLAIGQALSNELTFTIFNDTGALDNYGFGEFKATLGVKISTGNYSSRGSVYAESGSHTYLGSASRPYLKRDGVNVDDQPAAPPVCILVYDGTVYCFLSNWTWKAYNDSNGLTATGKSMHTWVRDKFCAMVGKGIFYNDSARLLKIWESGRLDTYEFCPLGKFTADRPNVPTVNEIDFTCYDFMTKFDRDMPSAATLGMSYPATIGTLYVKMCEYLGVEYESGSFINSTAVIEEEPEDFSSATMRDVLKWIAEAAAGNARFNRDGVLKIDWVKGSGVSVSADGYSSFAPYWYETQTVTKLMNRASDGSYDCSVGDGDAVYLIQDNPLLRGVT